MMDDKLRIIRLYKNEDVPDHILEEVQRLTQELLFCISECKAKCSNMGIFLSAFNRLHALIIVDVLTDEGLQDGVMTEMIGLMKNVEHLVGKSFDMGDFVE